MTSTETHPAPAQAPQRTNHRATFLAVALIGVVLAVNGAAFGSQVFLDPSPYSTIVSTPTYVAFYVLWTACLIALSQAYPRLATVSGSTGRRIGTAVATAAGVGAALDACSRFVEAFVNPYLGRNAPALLDSAPEAALLVPLLATGVVSMLATAVLAVVGWRRRVLGAGPAILLLVGAVAVPAIGPLSTVLIGAALAWLGIRLHRSA